MWWNLAIGVLGTRKQLVENTNPQVFVASQWCEAHVPLKMKTSDIEGKFVNKKKLKKGRANVYKAMHVGFGRQLKEAKAILAEENAEAPIGCSPPCGKKPPQGEFPKGCSSCCFRV